MHHVSIQWHSQPKSARRHSRRSCTRLYKRTNVRRRPSTNPSQSGTANPNAHRRRSRRSCIRQDKRAHARLRAKRQAENQRAQPPKSAPAAQPPQLHPAGQTHLRKTKGLNNRSQQDKPTHARPRTPTTRTRQRRAAQAAQTAVGDAQERILLRDDHVQSLRQHKVPTHQQKRFSLWGSGDISFWQAQKELPPRVSPRLSKGEKTKQKRPRLP